MLRNDDGWLSLASVKYKGFRNQGKGEKKKTKEGGENSEVVKGW